MDAKLIETLQVRLEKKKIDREQKQEFVRNLSYQLSMMLRNIPRVPKSSAKEIQRHVSDLETKIKTDSMPLKKEKHILRQISQLKGGLRQHAEYERVRQDIENIKRTRESTILAVRQVTKQIEELDLALRNLFLRGELMSKGIDIPVNSIVRVTCDVRSQDLPFLRDVDEMESEFGVVLKLDTDRLQMRIAGSEKSVASAKSAVEKITSAAIEVVKTKDNDEIKIISSNMPEICKIAKEKEIVAFMNKNSCWLRGKHDAIVQFRDFVSKTFLGGRAEIELEDKRWIGIVIGNRGSTISEMEKRFHVAIQVVEDDGKHFARISGPEEQVAACEKSIRELLKANVFQEMEVDVDNRSIASFVVGRGGAGVRKIQEESKCYVRLFDGTTKFTMRGRPADLETAQRLLRERVELWHRTNASIDLSDIHSRTLAISSVMSTLKSRVECASIVLSRERKTLMMRDEDESKLKSAVESAKKMIANEFGLFEMKAVNSAAIGALIGRKGATIKKMTTTTNTHIEIDDGNICVVGLKANVAAAQKLVEKIVDENYVERTSVPERFIGDFIGKGGSSLKAFAKKHNVSVDSDRHRRRTKDQHHDAENGKSREDNDRNEGGTFLIRGNSSNVKAAITAVGDYIRKLERENRELCVDKSRCGALIGNKGSRKKELEKSLGVRIDIDIDAERVILRGPEDALDRAEIRISEIAGKQAVWRPGAAAPHRIFVNVPAECVKHVVGTQRRVARKIESECDVVIHIAQKAQVLTIIGGKSAVEKARQAVERIVDDAKQCEKKLTGLFRDKLEAVFGEKLKGTRRLQLMISQRLKFVAESNSGGKKTSVVVSGTRRGFETACDAIVAAGKRCHVTKFVAIVREHIVALRSSERNLEKIARDYDCTIRIDDDISMFVIIGPPQKTIAARKQVFYMLNFLYEGHYAMCNLPEGVVDSLLRNRAASLLTFCKKHTACSPFFDRDARTMMFCSAEKDDVKAGHDAINAMLIEYQKTNTEISIPDADYIGVLIGPKGATISKIKKESGARRIDIARDEMLVRVSGEAEAVQKAKRAIEEFFARTAETNGTVSIDKDIVRHLIGKGGATIKRLRDETKCDLNISMDAGRDGRTATIRISGKATEDVARAKETILAFVEAETLRQKGRVVSVDPNMIPFIIGRKGARIQQMQTDFKCRVDIESRDDGRIRIRGDSEDIVSKAVEHLDELRETYLREMSRRASSNADDDGDDVPSSKSAAPLDEKRSEKKREQKESSSSFERRVVLSYDTDDVREPLSKSAKRRLRRKAKKMKENPLNVLLGNKSDAKSADIKDKTLAASSMSSAEHSSSRKPRGSKSAFGAVGSQRKVNGSTRSDLGVSKAMMMLGLETSSSSSSSKPTPAISPTPPGFEGFVATEMKARHPDSRVSGRNEDEVDGPDAMSGKYYSSRSGYKLRL